MNVLNEEIMLFEPYLSHHAVYLVSWLNFPQLIKFLIVMTRWMWVIQWSIGMIFIAVSISHTIQICVRTLWYRANGFLIGASYGTAGGDAIRESDKHAERCQRDGRTSRTRLWDEAQETDLRHSLAGDVESCHNQGERPLPSLAPYTALPPSVPLRLLSTPHSHPLNPITASPYTSLPLLTPLCLPYTHLPLP